MNIIKGERVETTGAGQTASYKGWKGTVINVTEDGRVTVAFDGPYMTAVVLLPDEVRSERVAGCPCARCNHS